MVPGMIRRVALLLCLFMPPSVRAELTYTTHWLGNTFGGGDSWVQNYAEGLAVAADGTCYVCSEWDEGGREIGIYRDGKVVGKVEETHGWGRGGGQAVAVSDKWLYVGMTQEGGYKHPEKNKNGELVFPAEWKLWFGIRRCTLDGKAAPFPGGAGWGEAFRAVTEVAVEKGKPRPRGHVAGLWAHGGELFASDPAGGLIRVYDEETMAEKRRFRAFTPGRLCVLRGLLHVVEDGARVAAYELTGRRTGQVLEEDDVKPGAIAPTPEGRLMVVEEGPRQQVLFYNMGGVPKLIRAMGEWGGVWSLPEPGAAGPIRFARPTGVGADAAGNFYIACNPPRGGCVLRSVRPDRETLRWELLGLEFVDVADVDPTSDGTDLYTADGRYALDLTKPPGQSWRWVAQTVAPFDWPHDLRLHHGNHLQCGTQLRVIGGKKFLILRGMWQHLLGVYALNGHIATPAAVLSAGPYRDGDFSPPGQPEKGAWLWRDANGDGRMTADEYAAAPVPQGEFWASYVDERGDIWQGARDGRLHHWRCEGLDERGIPRWDPAKVETERVPGEITDFLRLEYLAGQDVMLLGGQTAERKLTGGEWGTVGTELFCYEAWSKSAERKLRWRIPLAYEPGKKWAVSLAAAGDFAFTVDCKSAEVSVFSLKDGSTVGTLRPGPEVHGESGWVDFRDALRAYRKKDGTYLVTVEEDAKGKCLVYHVKP